MAIILRQSTAVDVLIGPFIDDTDGKTAETGLTLSQGDIKLSKNGQGLAQKNDDTAAAHDANGYYNCELDATDTNTVGQLTLIVHESGALPVRHEFQVVEEAVYDALFAASASGYAVTGAEMTLTAAYDAAKTAAQAGDQVDLIDAPNSTAVAALQAGLSTAAAVAAVAAVTDKIDTMIEAVP